jgi:RimJ/RimL family protein N-acetyltransferase
MDITIRLANPQTDFPRIAELRTMTERYPVTAEMLHEDEERQIAGKIRRRSVATANDGHIVGYSVAIHYPSQPQGRFHVSGAVDAVRRNQGVGTALYDDMLKFVREQGATRLYCEVREDSQESLRFATKRGFSVNNHAIESALDLSTFDESQAAGLIEAVEATGIHFCTFADTGITLEAQRKLYEINRIASTDDPASPDDTFPSFENWQKIILGASGFQPEGQILAVDGDRYVGLAAVSYDREANTAESMLTGVDCAYRGRKIAQALKLLTIRFAQARGATHITTENDSRNVAMLAINKKFGYKSQSGYFGLFSDQV